MSSSEKNRHAGRKKRIGLLGGSFNPPHEGHLLAAEFARAALAVDELWLLVTPRNPLKDPAQYAPLEDRMEMCRLMAGSRPWLKVTDIEKNFSSLRTIDTLTTLSEMNPDVQFIWIMGGDNLRDFHTWDSWQKILDNWPIAVMERQGTMEDALKSPAAAYAVHMKTKEPAQLGVYNNTGWCVLNGDDPGVSARTVIARMQQGTPDVSSVFNDLSPRGKRQEFQDVAAYILKRGLYRKPASSQARDGAGPTSSPA